jgi:hypothetical protein
MIDINLLPYEDQGGKRLKRNVIIFAAAAAVCFALMTWYILSLENDYASLRSEGAKLDHAVSAKASSAGSSKQQQADILVNKKIEVSPILAELEKQLPPKSKMQQFDYGNTGEIKLQCIFPTLESASNYLSVLNGQKGFTGAEITMITNLDPAGNKLGFLVGYKLNEQNQAGQP